MEVNELRIGNYVKFYDPINGTNIYKVYRINDSGSVSLEDKGQLASCIVKNIEPIELTEEVLLKIGFEDRKGYFNYSRVFGDDGDYCDSIYIYYCPKLNQFKFTHNIIKNIDLQIMDLYNIQYLHQLQNAYFLLTNQEMEIEL